MFIVFEHIDGSGGTTQIKLLEDWLWENTSNEVEIGCEPTNGTTGKFIRKILQKKINIREQDILTGLFIADRNEHMKEVNDFLNEDSRNIYICDRYYYSNMVYNAYDELGMNRIEEVNSIFRKPDLCFFIDVEPETAISRIENRGEEKELFETLGYLRTVKERYEILCKQGKMIKVDGNRSKEEVFEDIKKIIEKFLKNY